MNYQKQILVFWILFFFFISGCGFQSQRSSVGPYDIVEEKYSINGKDVFLYCFVRSNTKEVISPILVFENKRKLVVSSTFGEDNFDFKISVNGVEMKFDPKSVVLISGLDQYSVVTLCEAVEKEHFTLERIVSELPILLESI